MAQAVKEFELNQQGSETLFLLASFYDPLDRREALVEEELSPPKWDGGSGRWLVLLVDTDHRLRVIKWWWGGVVRGGGRLTGKGSVGGGL